MNKTIRLALIGASVLALTSPVLARTATKSDRMTSHSVTGVGEPNTAPVLLRERAPEQMVYGWNQSAGFDRLSRRMRAASTELYRVSLLDTRVRSGWPKGQPLSFARTLSCSPIRQSSTFGC